MTIIFAQSAQDGKGRRTHWPSWHGNKMASGSSVEKITCVCGEVVLSCKNQNYLKVVLACKMLVLSRRLREAQGMHRSDLII